MVTKAINDTSSMKKRVYTIKYENLIQSTEVTMRKVLKFIEEPWDEKVLNHEKYNLGEKPF
ncbi:MAG: hypothetical protein ACOCRX_11430, partial [Candidatus Woesearchaeota archaeon]